MLANIKMMREVKLWLFLAMMAIGLDIAVKYIEHGEITGVVQSLGEGIGAATAVWLGLWLGAKLRNARQHA
jgi:hypothetical protein